MPHDPSSAARPRRAAFFRCFLASLLLVLVAAGASVYLNAVAGSFLKPPCWKMWITPRWAWTQPA